MKISVSLAPADLEFVDEQTRSGRYSSRSAAVQAAIRAMRDSQHVDSYAAAWDEWDAGDSGAGWDATAGDGIR